MRGLPFRLGTDLYALRLADISEVLPLASMRQVPGVDAAVAGLLNLHGRAVPVIDLAVHCLGRAEPIDVRTRIVLLARSDVARGSATPAGVMGLVLCTTGDIVDIPAEAVQPCPLSTANLPFLSGMSQWAGETLQWIGLPALRTTVSAILRESEPQDA